MILPGRVFIQLIVVIQTWIQPKRKLYETSEGSVNSNTVLNTSKCFSVTSVWYKSIVTVLYSGTKRWFTEIFWCERSLLAVLPISRVVQKYNCFSIGQRLKIFKISQVFSLTQDHGSWFCVPFNFQFYCNASKYYRIYEGSTKIFRWKFNQAFRVLNKTQTNDY